MGFITILTYFNQIEHSELFVVEKQFKLLDFLPSMIVSF